MFSALRILGADDRRTSAGLGAYEHGTVTVNDAVTGEPQVIRIKEAVENVVQSPAFQQTKARAAPPTVPQQILRSESLNQLDCSDPLDVLARWCRRLH